MHELHGALSMTFRAHVLGGNLQGRNTHQQLSLKEINSSAVCGHYSKNVTVGRTILFPRDSWGEHGGNTGNATRESGVDLACKMG